MPEIPFYAIAMSSPLRTNAFAQKAIFSFVLRLGGRLLALRISAYMSLQQECLLWLLLRTPLAKAPGASFMEPALF